MKLKKWIIIATVCVSVLAIVVILIWIINMRNGDTHKEDSVHELSEENDDSAIGGDTFRDFPVLDNLIGVSLEDVKTEYTGGETIVSNTTWGEVWTSYEFENDKFILIADGKATGIVDSATLVIKELTSCPMDERVLEIAEDVVVYGHIDPEKIGIANNPGIYDGMASYYGYKTGYVLSVYCYTDLNGAKYSQVSLFKNPNL